VLTWPLLPRLGTAVSDPGDPLLHAWILAWDLHALATRPLGLFDANIFHPHRWTLAFSDHLLGLVPLAAPVALADGGPVLAHNVAVFVSFPLTGLAMFWLVRHLTGHGGAALVAAVLYAFSHYRFAHLAQVQLLSHYWLPLLLLALHRAVASGGRTRDLALATLAFVGQALASGYYALFAVVAGGVFAAWVAAPAARPPLARVGRRGAVAALVAGLLLVPAYLPYHVVRREYGLVRPLGEVEDYSAGPTAYLTLPPSHPWFDALGERFVHPEGALFPGAVTVALAIAGAVGGLATAPTPAAAPRDGPQDPGRRWPRWLDPLLAGWLALTLVDVLFLGGIGLQLGPVRVHHRTLWVPVALVAGALGVRRLVQRRPAPLAGLGWLRRLGWPRAAGLYIALTAVGVLCSFGPTLRLDEVPLARPLYWQLYRFVPGFDGLRVPARFALLAATGLAVLAGYGVAAIGRRCPGTIARHAWVAGLAGLAMLEAAAIPLPLHDVTAPVGPADRWLAAAPPGPVVVLPLHPEPDAWGEARRLLGSTAHWRPLVNGYSGFFPPGYWRTVELLNGFPEAPALARLRELGVRHVVVYLRQLTPARRARMRAALAALPPGVLQVAAFEQTAILEIRP
ncbi:MAG: hypothetical protein HY359_05415, partial [Candidatus Rokubacteria bacterium]|nr:hypothetical protein [Candidatus Rokubacteria bacterium]